jgi:glutathione S-transferase
MPSSASLLEVYDPNHRLSYATEPEKWQQNAWKHFQTSGQGPYIGQLSWFRFLHEEKLPSAISRYEAELRRILGVIDAHLARTGQPYLVGSKLSFADLMFVPYNTLILMFFMGQSFAGEWKDKFPSCWAWHERLLQVESVQRAEAFVQKSATERPGKEAEVEAPK